MPLPPISHIRLIYPSFLSAHAGLKYRCGTAPWRLDSDSYKCLCGQALNRSSISADKTEVYCYFLSNVRLYGTKDKDKATMPKAKAKIGFGLSLRRFTLQKRKFVHSMA